MLLQGTCIYIHGFTQTYYIWQRYHKYTSRVEKLNESFPGLRKECYLHRFYLSCSWLALRSPGQVSMLMTEKSSKLRYYSTMWFDPLPLIWRISGFMVTTPCSRWMLCQHPRVSDVPRVATDTVLEFLEVWIHKWSTPITPKNMGTFFETLLSSKYLCFSLTPKSVDVTEWILVRLYDQGVPRCRLVICGWCVKP